MNYNEFIFFKLEEKGIKQQDLANKLNISKSVVSNWKTRGTNPPIEYIVQICELIDMTPNELFGVHRNEIEELYNKLNETDKQIVDLIFDKYKDNKPELKSSTFMIG